MASFGNRVSVDVIKNLELRSAHIQGGPRSVDRCPCKREAESDQRHRDTGRRPQGDGNGDGSFAVPSQKMPGASRSWKKQGRILFCSPQRERRPADT